MKTLTSFTIAGALLVCGTLMLQAGAAPTLDQQGVSLVATSDADLVGVTGLQIAPGTPPTGGGGNGLCCDRGQGCTPTPPVLPGTSACLTIYSGGEPNGCGTREDAPCWEWSGGRNANGRCVAPPSGSTGAMNCTMDPGSYQCRKYRTGVCDTYYVPVWDWHCYCYLNSTAVWANGQRKCAAGFTPCTAVGGGGGGGGLVAVAVNHH